MTDLTNTKKCTKCKEEKLLSLFSNGAGLPLGKIPNCKSCVSEYCRGWYLRNKQKVLENSKKWKEKNSERRKASCRAYRVKNKDRLSQKNKDYAAKNPQKMLERRRSDYWKNREAKLAKNKKYNKENPWMMRAVKQRRRARMAAAKGNFVSSDIKEIFNLQRGKCGYCKKSIKSGYHIDHIIPLVKGGSNYRNNIQLLCQRCNNQKCAKDPIVFAQSKGFLL